MGHDYIELMFGNKVVSIPNEKDFLNFIELMKELGIKPIVRIEQLYNKYGFDKAFCFSGGSRQYPTEELCFSFNYEHGFIPGSKDDHIRENEDVKVITIKDIVNDTHFDDRKDKVFMVIGSGIIPDDGEEWYEHLTITRNPEKANQDYKKYSKDAKFAHVELISEEIDRKNVRGRENAR